MKKTNKTEMGGKPDAANTFRSGFQTALIGGLAAAAAFGLAKLISR